MSGALLRSHASHEKKAGPWVCTLGPGPCALAKTGPHEGCGLLAGVPQKVRGPGVSRGLSTERAVPGSAPTVISFSRLLNGLAVQREIETLLLDLGGHPQPDDHVDDLENDQRHDHVVDEDRADADRLVDDLHRIALEQSGGAAVLADREHAGENRAGGAADPVHPEGVERVVVAERVLEAGAAPVADDAGRDA